MNIAAVDFETYYDKTVSITTLGVWHYLRHELSDIYMVSIKTSDGREFVGHPHDAPWSDISGPGWTWLSHNAAFDEEVMIRLRELFGWDYAPERWECTADMAAYLGMPRSLAGACKELLNIELSKDVRDKMKGKRWESMPDDFKAEVTQYALADAVLAQAETLAEEAVGSHQFTKHAKKLSLADRVKVIEAIYLVVLADGERSDEEEAYVRHVAGLLYVDDISRAEARKRAEARSAGTV